MRFIPLSLARVLSSVGSSFGSDGSSYGRSRAMAEARCFVSSEIQNAGPEVEVLRVDRQQFLPERRHSAAAPPTNAVRSAAISAR